MFAGVLSEDLLRRIFAEYAEMPGLRLTRQQAQRLWALDAETCLAALEYLAESKFLYLARSGQYVRLTDGPPVFPRVRMAKATLAQRPVPNSESVGRADTGK